MKSLADSTTTWRKKGGDERKSFCIHLIRILGTVKPPNLEHVIQIRISWKLFWKLLISSLYNFFLGRKIQHYNMSRFYKIFKLFQFLLHVLRKGSLKYTVKPLNFCQIWKLSNLEHSTIFVTKPTHNNLNFSEPINF